MPHALWELHDLLQRATAEQRYVLGKLIEAPYGSAPHFAIISVSSVEVRSGSSSVVTTSNSSQTSRTASSSIGATSLRPQRDGAALPASRPVSSGYVVVYVEVCELSEISEIRWGFIRFFRWIPLRKTSVGAGPLR
jgi:hypothetical protein